MTTSNKRSNGHRNAVMNHSRVQRAVSSVIADQTRAEELLEQLKTTETTLGESDAPKTSETPEDKQPEPTEKQEAPAASQSLLDERLPAHQGETGEENKLLKLLADMNNGPKAFLEHWGVTPKELGKSLAQLLGEQEALLQAIRDRDLRQLLSVLVKVSPFKLPVVKGNLFALIPDVLPLVEKFLKGALGQDMADILMPSLELLFGKVIQAAMDAMADLEEIVKDITEEPKAEEVVNKIGEELKVEETATSSAPSDEAERPSPRLASETIIVNGTRHILVANAAEILERNGCETDKPLCIDEYGLYMIINQRPMRCNWMA